MAQELSVYVILKIMLMRRAKSAINPATVIMPCQTAPTKYILENVFCGQTLAPIIPIINRSVPKTKKPIISPENLENRGKIWVIILAIIYVHERKMTDRIMIGRRKSIEWENPKWIYALLYGNLVECKKKSSISEDFFYFLILSCMVPIASSQIVFSRSGPVNHSTIWERVSFSIYHCHCDTISEDTQPEILISTLSVTW